MRTPVQVLLVEDNPGDAELTKLMLESGQFQVEVSVTIDGQDALSYLQGLPPYATTRQPDMIMLDLNLPKLDGRAVLAEIKRHQDLCKIPVLIFSSSDAAQDIEETYRLGASCYVIKPFGLEEFQTTLRSVELFWFAVARLP